MNVDLLSLKTETPSETAARSIILIAKSLQNLANLVEFGVKVITKTIEMTLKAHDSLYFLFSLFLLFFSYLLTNFGLF